MCHNLQICGLQYAQNSAEHQIMSHYVVKALYYSKYIFAIVKCKGTEEYKEGMCLLDVQIRTLTIL